MRKGMRWLVGIGVVAAVAVGLFFYFDLHRLRQALPAERDAAMAALMAAAKLPGVAVLRIEGGEVVLAAGYGVADPATSRPVTPETVFAVASFSQPVTAAALMTLVEAGAVDLDADVNAYLPFRVAHPSFPDTPITLRQLLAHTGGLNDGGTYRARYTLNESPVSEDSPVALEAFLRDYLVPGGLYYEGVRNFTSWAPGQGYRYSEAGYALIGLVVEEVAGMPFDAYCREAVFEPLGMDSSAWFYRDVDRARVAVPTRYRGWARRYEALGLYGFPTIPEGGLKTTVGDAGRFVRALLFDEGRGPDGTRFLRPETVAAMLTPTFTEVGSQVAAGWTIVDGEAQVGGGDPGVFAMAVVDPAAQDAVIAFANGDGGSGLGVLRLRTFMARVGEVVGE